MIMKRGMAVFILTLGKRVTYPPKIPDMAPDAPMTGIVELLADNKYTKDAIIPQSR